MKKTLRKSSIAFAEVRSSIENYSTKFSSLKFVKRVDLLTDEQRNAIEETGFGYLLRVPNQTMNRKLLLELMDKWSSEKKAFVLGPGELAVTLLDVALITGLRAMGKPVLLKDEEPFSELEMQFGASPEKRKISVDSLENRLDSLGGIASDDFVRTFLLFVFGVFLFPDTSGNVDSRYLAFLKIIDDIREYAWGSAVLHEIRMWLDKRKDSNTQSVGGCLTFLQIWSYEHIDLARPGLLDDAAFPRACRWENRKYIRPQPITTMFDELENEQIIWTLEPTPYELEVDVIRELMKPHNEGNKIPGGQDLSPVSPMVGAKGVKSEIASNIDTANETSRAGEEKQLLRPCPCELQDQSDPSTDVEYPTMSSSLRYSLVEQLPSTSRDSSVELPAEDEGSLVSKNLKLEERVLELEKQMDSFRLENLELKKEVDDLRRENRARSLASEDFVSRLEKLITDDEV